MFLFLNNEYMGIQRKASVYLYKLFCSMYQYRPNISFKEKKEEIWLSSMTNAPTSTVKSKKQRDNTKNATKTSITQRLRTVTPPVWLNEHSLYAPITLD